MIDTVTKTTIPHSFVTNNEPYFIHMQKMFNFDIPTPSMNMVFLFCALTVSELMLILVYKVVAHYAESAFYSQIGDPFILWGVRMEPGAGIIYNASSETVHDIKERNKKIQNALKPINMRYYSGSQITHQPNDERSQENNDRQTEESLNTFCPICLNDYGTSHFILSTSILSIFILYISKLFFPILLFHQKLERIL